MARPLMLRMAGALAATSVAVLVVAAIPLVGTSLNAGADESGKAPFSVNREFKGDRLPLPVGMSTAPATSPAPAPRGQFGLQHARPREIPLGCDAAFSPITAPSLASIYGRCMT